MGTNTTNARSGIRPTRPWCYWIRQIAPHLALGAAAAAVCLPFVWMLITSVKVPTDIFSGSFWPSGLRGNYPRGLAGGPFGRYFYNTAFVAVATVVLQLFTSAAATLVREAPLFRSGSPLLHDSRHDDGPRGSDARRQLHHFVPAGMA